MARFAQNVVQHDFGFPRIIGSGVGCGLVPRSTPL
jgi:hypothetical protein